MTRSPSPIPGLEVVRGRYEWTEEKTPVDPAAELARAMEAHVATLRGQARGRMRTLQVVLIVLGVLAWAALALGCAHDPEPAKPRLVVLPEREGQLAARVIGALTGQRPTATTLPGGVVVVFQPADAADPCLLAHETVHVADQHEMGPVPWLVEYGRQLAECEARPGADRGTCLRTIPLEQAAYKAQHECQERRADAADGSSAWMAKGGR
jgi:hypothetical protein